jgi:hypothetical protein
LKIPFWKLKILFNYFKIFSIFPSQIFLFKKTFLFFKNHFFTNNVISVKAAKVLLHYLYTSWYGLVWTFEHTSWSWDQVSFIFIQYQAGTGKGNGELFFEEIPTSLVLVLGPRLVFSWYKVGMASSPLYKGSFSTCLLNN